MSPELIGIMTVGVAIAALQMLSIKGLREDMNASIKGLREDLKGLREDMDKCFAALDQRVGALEQRLARLEGMIDGLFNRRPQVETAPAAAPLTGRK